MYKNILLATDGSEHSKRALENAINIAKCTEGSKVDVVYVIDASKAKSDVLNNWNSVDVNDSRMKQLKNAEKLAKESGVSYEIKILHGEPGPTIVDYADKSGSDIVIIGSRGLNGLQEFMLGSVSHKVAKRANCPVLIVK
ncbi:universal stress protein [Oceanobacillus damuensis]|uniref:universal stress protein n=1 Tax=Oceanobacillus damuensis TaxID=937928 RepID=UPI00082FD957|nr:universal stress protein [Oceanobacillus damuensis]